MDLLRVLIVDDEEELVNALVERLELRKIEAKGVTSGQEALDALENAEFDVVLLDVKMPGLGGLQVIKQIKEDRPNLQVIMLTGHGSEQDADLGVQLGCFEYLMKPVNIDNLIEVMNKAAGRSCAEE